MEQKRWKRTFLPSSQSYRNRVQRFTTEYDVSCGVFCNAFYQIEGNCPIPRLLRVAVFKSWISVEFCQRHFLLLWGSSYDFSFIVCWMLNQPYIPGLNSLDILLSSHDTLSFLYIPWFDSVCQCFSRAFESVFIKSTGVFFGRRGHLFVWFRYQGNANFLEQARQHLPPAFDYSLFKYFPSLLFSLSFHDSSRTCIGSLGLLNLWLWKHCSPFPLHVGGFCSTRDARLWGGGCAWSVRGLWWGSQSCFWECARN